MASIATLVDRVKIYVLSSGTGAFQLGSAVPAFRGIEALVDGATYNYATENGSNFEVGTGVYLQASGTMVRTPLLSSAGGAAVAFPSNIELSFTALASDYDAQAGAEAGASAGASAGAAAGAVAGASAGAAAGAVAAQGEVNALAANLSAAEGIGEIGFSNDRVYPENSMGRYFTRQLALSAAPFNVPLDGSSDATAAINAWAAQGGAGTELIVPPGDFLFSSAINFGAINKLMLAGKGKRTSRFLYTGNDTTVNMVSFGQTGTPTQIDLFGFCVDRHPAMPEMTAGFCIAIYDAVNGWTMREVTPGSTGNTVKMSSGLFLSNPNSGFVSGYEFRAAARGIVIAGSDTDSGSDVRLDQGLILGGTDQIEVAGGFGGLYIGQHLGYGGDTGLSINERLSTSGNREIFLSNMSCLDAQNIAHILINVTQPNLLIDCAAWLSGAGFFTPNPGDGIRVQSAPNSRISIHSGHIKSAKRDGIRVEDATTEILVSPATFITDCAGWGVNATVPTSKVSLFSKVEYNVGGQVAPNIRSYTEEPVTASSGGTSWLYDAKMQWSQQGNLFSIAGNSTVTVTTLGAASGVIAVTVSRTIKTSAIGTGVNLNTGAVVYVRAEAGNNYVSIQQDGGGYPFTASGQTIRFAIDFEISQ